MRWWGNWGTEKMNYWPMIIKPVSGRAGIWMQAFCLLTTLVQKHFHICHLVYPHAPTWYCLLCHMEENQDLNISVYYHCPCHAYTLTRLCELHSAKKLYCCWFLHTGAKSDFECSSDINIHKLFDTKKWNLILLPCIWTGLSGLRLTEKIKQMWHCDSGTRT